MVSPPVHWHAHALLPLSCAREPPAATAPVHALALLPQAAASAPRLAGRAHHLLACTQSLEQEAYTAHRDLARSSGTHGATEKSNSAAYHIEQHSSDGELAPLLPCELEHAHAPWQPGAVLGHAHLPVPERAQQPVPASGTKNSSAFIVVELNAIRLTPGMWKSRAFQTAITVSTCRFCASAAFSRLWALAWKLWACTAA